VGVVDLMTRSEQWRRDRRVRRVEPGHGRRLKPFRWWQLMSRALFHLDLDGVRWTVDAAHWKQMTDEDGKASAYLYRDGEHVGTSTLPASFPVPGGTIEVQNTTFGLRKCHYRRPDGTEQQLVPDPRSAEGRRARFGQDHPVAGRVVGAVSILVLVVAVLPLLAQIVGHVSEIPPIAENLGTFTSPVELSFWANAGLAVAAAAASTERALRLRYSAFLDGAAG
jgi:hypothetical protein